MAERVGKVPLGGGQVLRIARGPHLLFGHIHGVDHGRAQRLGGEGGLPGPEGVKGEEEPLQQSPQLGGDVVKINRGTAYDPVGGSEGGQQLPRPVGVGAAAVGGTALSLAGKAAAAAGIGQVKEMDQLGLCSGVGGSGPL